MELTGAVFVQEGHSARDEIHGALEIVGFGAGCVFQFVPQENARPRAGDQRIEEEGREERQIIRALFVAIADLFEDGLDQRNPRLRAHRRRDLADLRSMVGNPADKSFQAYDFALERCIEHFPADMEKFVLRRAGRNIRGDWPKMMRRPMFDGSKKQRRFRPEPGIERALRDASGDRDPLHARAFHAMGDELLECHIKNMNAQSGRDFLRWPASFGVTRRQAPDASG